MPGSVMNTCRSWALGGRRSAPTTCDTTLTLSTNFLLCSTLGKCWCEEGLGVWAGWPRKGGEWTTLANRRSSHIPSPTPSPSPSTSFSPAPPLLRSHITLKMASSSSRLKLTAHTLTGQSLCSTVASLTQRCREPSFAVSSELLRSSRSPLKAPSQSRALKAWEIWLLRLRWLAFACAASILCTAAALASPTVRLAGTWVRVGASVLVLVFVCVCVCVESRAVPEEESATKNLPFRLPLLPAKVSPIAPALLWYTTSGCMALRKSLPSSESKSALSLE
mmetsp:Transcript_10925/g.24222  ORF Transcript_10925/g.24222 Transcript_10925/m.24222 type:complete len:278 (-) Transcript_10925:678-1511(-)